MCCIERKYTKYIYVIYNDANNLGYITISTLAVTKATFSNSHHHYYMYTTMHHLTTK